MKKNFTELNNILFYYSVSGPEEAMPLIFIHGLGLESSIWQKQVENFSANYRVITYDVRGHGRTDIADGQYSIDLFAEDLIALLDHLGIEKAVLCGLSMGGYIALRTIDLYPSRVHGLILCDSKSYADSNKEKAERFKQVKTLKTKGTTLFAAEMVSRLFCHNTIKTNPDLISSVLKTLESNNVTGLAGALLAIASRVDTSECLKRITVPTLIISGEKDKQSLPLDAQYLNHFITGSFLKMIPEAGHLSNMENPEVFNNEIENFINKKLSRFNVFSDQSLQQL